MSGRRHLRLLGGLSLAAAVVAAGAGIAYGFLSDPGGGTGYASTGSASLTVNSPLSHVCSYSSLSPGDLTGASACSLSVTYGGSISAYVSLTVTVQSKAGAGGTPLYNGNSGGLTLSASDGHNAFSLPAGPGTTGGVCPAGYRCWSDAYDIAAWYSGSTPNLLFVNGDGATFIVTPTFLKSVGNSFQGGTATVTLTAQAVQSAANTLPASCTTSTIGLPCPASGSFSWS